jgi:hypothetical protein
MFKNLAGAEISTDGNKVSNVLLVTVGAPYKEIAGGLAESERPPIHLLRIPVGRRHDRGCRSYP